MMLKRRYYGFLKIVSLKLFFNDFFLYPLDHLKTVGGLIGFHMFSYVSNPWDFGKFSKKIIVLGAQKESEDNFGCKFM